MTARNLQDKVRKAGLPWSAAKGFDTFTPVGCVSFFWMNAFLASVVGESWVTDPILYISAVGYLNKILLILITSDWVLLWVLVQHPDLLAESNFLWLWRSTVKQNKMDRQVTWYSKFRNLLNMSRQSWLLRFDSFFINSPQLTLKDILLKNRKVTCYWPVHPLVLALSNRETTCYVHSKMRGGKNCWN